MLKNLLNLDISNRKKIIVSGCSYSDNWWTREYGWPVWPELLAEKLDMECILSLIHI